MKLRLIFKKLAKSLVKLNPSKSLVCLVVFIDELSTFIMYKMEKEKKSKLCRECSWKRGSFLVKKSCDGRRILDCKIYFNFF